MEAKSLVVCARRLRPKKEKPKNTRYHNSIYRFIFFFSPISICSFRSFTEKREGKDNNLSLSLSLSLARWSILPLQVFFFINARLIANKHNEHTWALGSHTHEKKKDKNNARRVQTQERKVHPSELVIYSGQAMAARRHFD